MFGFHQVGVPEEENWLGRLASFLPGADAMSSKDRMALVSQGLLAMGAGILKNNYGHRGKAGPAIGAGISEGLLAMNKGADNLSEQKYRQQVMERQMGDPAGVREFNMMTQGLSDDERERARRIALGLEGRASSAGYGFDMVTDGSGIPRPQRMNPRTGTIEQYASEIGQWVPLDGAAPQQAAPSPRADFLGMADQFGAKITSLYRSPEHNRAVGGVPDSQHMKGTAGDFVVPPQAKPQFIAEARARGYEAIDEGDHVHLELPTFKPAPIPGLGRGRRKEDEAAAVAAAQKAVELGALPAELQMRTNAAIEQARGTAMAGADVERDAQTRQKMQALAQYEAARTGLVTGLAGTETGPVAGRLPAVTEGQQIAEGGVAAMAPVLKQLFRSAGEGVFTDRDQALLMEMLPTRTDHPTAAAAKIRNIDAIIRAKLGSAGDAAGAASGLRRGSVEDGYRFLGGDPADPRNWERL